VEDITETGAAAALPSAGKKTGKRATFADADEELIVLDNEEALMNLGKKKGGKPTKGKAVKDEEPEEEDDEEEDDEDQEVATCACILRCVRVCVYVCVCVCLCFTFAVPFCLPGLTTLSAMCPAE